MSPLSFKGMVAWFFFVCKSAPPRTLISKLRRFHVVFQTREDIRKNVCIGGVGDGADAIFNLALIRIAKGIYDSRNFEQKQLKMA
jgi:hypothetical protein